MKDLLRAGLACLILGLLILAGQSWSATGPALRKPKTRVAVLNLLHVIKSYDKHKAFQTELEEAVKPFQERDEKWKKSAGVLTEEAKSLTITPERRAEIEKQQKELQRKVEDNKDEGIAALARRREEQLKILYREVQEATRRVAKECEFDLVLHFNGHVAADELTSAKNIARKVNAGAGAPLYVADGLDISNEIIKRLNDRYRAAR